MLSARRMLPHSPGRFFVFTPLLRPAPTIFCLIARLLKIFCFLPVYLCRLRSFARLLLIFVCSLFSFAPASYFRPSLARPPKGGKTVSLFYLWISTFVQLAKTGLQAPARNAILRLQRLTYQGFLQGPLLNYFFKTAGWLRVQRFAAAPAAAPA